MANFGLFDSNHSQFAVAMDHISEFEKNHVIFGRVLSGMEVRALLQNRFVGILITHVTFLHM